MGLPGAAEGPAVDDGLHAAESQLTCLYSTEAPQAGGTITVRPWNGKAVEITLPAAGFVIFA